MIVLTNLHGERLAINDELIERVEDGHETRVVLTSGTHYIVTEPVDEVVRRCRQHRAEILALSLRIHLPPAPPEPDTSPDGADGAELRLLREDRRGPAKGGR
jgi:flagellar protein FlbD